MPRFFPAVTRVRIPHALGAIEAGQVVTIEPVAVGIVRVHLPADAVMFTTSAAHFDRA